MGHPKLVDAYPVGDACRNGKVLVGGIGNDENLRRYVAMGGRFLTGFRSQLPSPPPPAGEIHPQPGVRPQHVTSEIYRRSTYGLENPLAIRGSRRHRPFARWGGSILR
jgi:hypothetical protein